MDRPDVQFPVKELMRRVSEPTQADWTALKRVARYLLTMPRVVAKYPWGPLPSELVVYVDADWAGCLRTRKSTVEDDSRFSTQQRRKRTRRCCERRVGRPWHTSWYL